MLRPRDTSTRERKNLNGLWQFALDQAGEGRSGQWFAGPLPGAREMAVPASFNDIAADATVRDYFGDIWYQTQRLDTAWLAGTAHRAALRVRDPPRHGVGEQQWRWSPTKADTPRSRPTSPST